MLSSYDQPRVFAKVMGVMKVLIEPASPSRKPLAKTSRNEPAGEKRSIASASGQWVHKATTAGPDAV